MTLLYVSNSVLGVLHAFSHLPHPSTLWGCFSCPHPSERKVRHRILAWIVQGLSAGEWWSQACHWWSPKVDLMHFTSRCEIFWLCVILLSTEKLTVIIMIIPKNHQNIFYLQQNFLNAVWGVGLERNFITSTINLMKTGLNYSLLFLGSFFFYLQTSYFT